MNKITNGTAAAIGHYKLWTESVLQLWYLVYVTYYDNVHVFNTTQKKTHSNSHNTHNVLILYSTTLCCALLDYVIILSSLKKCWTEQGVESDLCSAMRDRRSFWEQRPLCVLRSQGVLWWTAVTLKLKEPVAWKIVLSHFRWPF